MMRTETQKKMDGVAGLENVEYKLDEETGKIVESGIVNKSFEGEVLENNMEAYKQQVEGFEKQLEDAKAKLKLCEEVEETKEVKKFIETQKNVGLFLQKKGLVDVVKKREEELQYHRDNLVDQERLIGEWKEWKEKHPVEEEPAPGVI